MRNLVGGAELLAARLAVAAPLRHGGPAARHAAQAVVAARAPGPAAARQLAAAAAAVPAPDGVAETLAAMRLLHAVPFSALVPDARLLPDETMLFFAIDEEWVDELVRGALAVGAQGTRELTHADETVGRIAPAVRRLVPTVRARSRGVPTTVAGISTALAARAQGTPALDRPDPGAAAAALEVPVTGFLLRSALVSGWPGLSVRAWTTDDTALLPLQADPGTVDPALVVPLLRAELLAPSVLLVLFAGVPRTVWLEEPHAGVQFGVDLDGATGARTVTLVGRDGRELPGAAPVHVPMRTGGAPGVVDVDGLADALAAAAAAAPQALRQAESATLALTLLQPPYRQRLTAGAPA